jgi:hypothetical protein
MANIHWSAKTSNRLRVVHCSGIPRRAFLSSAQGPKQDIRRHLHGWGIDPANGHNREWPRHSEGDLLLLLLVLELDEAPMPDPCCFSFYCMFTSFLDVGFFPHELPWRLVRFHIRICIPCWRCWWFGGLYSAHGVLWELIQCTRTLC